MQYLYTFSLINNRALFRAENAESNESIDWWIEPVMGATMRLGQRKTVLRPFKGGESSLSAKLYGGVSEVMERHRHRWVQTTAIIANPLPCDSMITRWHSPAGCKWAGQKESVFVPAKGIGEFDMSTQKTTNPQKLLEATKKKVVFGGTSVICWVSAGFFVYRSHHELDCGDEGT